MALDRSWRALQFGALLCLAATLRLPGVLWPEGLWADEVSSLALATGHSLEHPAARARPELGDFVEPAGAEPAARYREYLRLDSTSTMDRVLRAVWLADTNPPLFYLLLNWWVRLVGTSDAALRLLPMLLGLAALPPLWLIGHRLAGWPTAVMACLLYALVPSAIYYAHEVRTYTLVWVLATLLTWSAIKLHDGVRRVGLVVWVLAGAAGMLAHYFFVFVWLASVMWLLLFPGAAGRKPVLFGALLTALIISPWYSMLPEILSHWRVTGEWLDGPLSLTQIVLAPPRLAWAMVSPRGPWGDRFVVLDRLLRPAAFVLLALGLLASRKGVFAREHLLFWLILASAVLGPVVFDLLRGTRAATVTRYAFAALPAELLLLGVALTRVRIGWAAAALALLLLGWTPGIRAAVRADSRELNRHLAAAAASWARPTDVVIVQSFPAFVLAVARYLPAEVLLVPWIESLGQRTVPASLIQILEGRTGAALITTPGHGEPTPVEAWLRREADPQTEEPATRSSPLYFRPRRGKVFRFDSRDVVVERLSRETRSSHSPP